MTESQGASDVRSGFDRDWDCVLRRNGLPKAPGQVLDVKYRMRTNDWYVETSKGWWWLSRRPSGMKWESCPQGPL